MCGVWLISVGWGHRLFWTLFIEGSLGRNSWMRDPERTGFASELPLAASPRVPKSIPAPLGVRIPGSPRRPRHAALQTPPSPALPSPASKSRSLAALLIPSCALFFSSSHFSACSLSPSLPPLPLSPVKGWLSCQDNCGFWEDAVNLPSGRHKVSGGCLTCPHHSLEIA